MDLVRGLPALTPQRRQPSRKGATSGVGPAQEEDPRAGEVLNWTVQLDAHSV